ADAVRRQQRSLLKLLVLGAKDVERLMPMADCIGVMESAFRDLCLGQVEQPLRMVLKPQPAPGLMAFMPAWRRPAERGVFHGNVAKGMDSHQGAVLLFDGLTGVPLAAMNASAITSIRTAAVSGLATRLLARADASDAAIIGSGVEARTHLVAMACVRKL